MEAFLHGLGGFLTTAGFLFIVGAVVYVIAQYFASLDPYTQVAGAAGFLSPITTVIMIIGFALTQPDKTFPATLSLLLGIGALILGGMLSG